jgi:LCP family protein required for cell wall assembly
MFEKKEMPKMPNKKSLLIPILLGVLAVVVLLGGFLIIRGIYQAPLAPAMNLPTSTKPAPAVDATSLPTAVPVAAPVCGQTGSMTLLFMGSDTSFGNPPYGADSVRIFKADFDAQKITSVTFSRDLVVPAVALNNPSHPQAPLGLIFYYARQASSGTSTQTNAAAARVMAQVVMEDFGVGLTNYVTLQMDNVAVMIDEVGGVQLNVPAAITTEHNVYYSAGLQTLSGSLATEYVRFLNPGGEAARTARQNAFIQALLARLTDVSILPHIPALLTEYQNAVTTDLSPEQLVNLTCLAGKMPQGNLVFASVDTPDLVTNNVPNFAAVKNFLNLTLGE